MICTGCGAGLTRAMVDDGECGYCHTVVARAVPKTDEIVAKAVEKLASVKGPDPEPKVLVRVIAPDVPRVTVDGARVIDSIGARIAGCFTGCMSMGVSIGITAMILGFVAWSLWMENRGHAPPSPSPAPAPVTAPAPSPSPSPDRPRRGRGR